MSKPKKTYHSALLGGVAALLLCGSALAGPPLICHPFVTGADAKLLPWAPAAKNWNTPDRAYRVENLTSDTLRLLTPDAPILSRMENLRRATIYASENPRVAAELLQRLLERAAHPAADERSAALAQFDLGYLVETYRQFGHALNFGMLDGKHVEEPLESFAKSASANDAVQVAALDGRETVRRVQKALPSLQAELEFAAALMSPDNKTFAAHRDRAAVGAPPGSLLAQNLAIYE